MKTNPQTIGGWMLAFFLATIETGLGQTASSQDSLSSIQIELASGQIEPLSLNATDMRAVRSLSEAQLAAFVLALDATPIIPFASQPRKGMAGTFYSLQHPEWPPLPGNTSQSAVWQMNNFYLLDDVNYNYNAPVKSRTTMQAMTLGGPPSPGGGGDGGGTNVYYPEGNSYTIPDYGTNLWIAQVAITNGHLAAVASNTLADVQYEILTNADLGTTNWASTGQFIPGAEDTNWTPFITLPVSLTNNLFFRLRSWMDSDNVGIPDWWQLQYFGYVGIDPYAPSPSGDGFAIWQKYQNELNPTNFETPPAPANFIAVLSTNGTGVLLSWSPAQGAVTDYKIIRNIYNPATYNYDFATNVVSAGTNSFEDVGAIGSGDDVANDYYLLTADYPGGNTSFTANSYLYSTAPPPPPPAPIDDLAVSARLVRNATGRWQLMFSAIPSGVETIRLIWHTDAENYGIFSDQTPYTSQDIYPNNVTNNIYEIPDAEALDHLGDVLYMEGLTANGQSGQTIYVGVLPDDAPYFVDGRQHMKQNLEFLIRGAGLTCPIWG